MILCQQVLKSHGLNTVTFSRMFILLDNRLLEMLHLCSEVKFFFLKKILISSRISLRGKKESPVFNQRPYQPCGRKQGPCSKEPRQM